jgi:WD40 repeat protein
LYVDWSLDGRTLISVSQDNTARLWDTESGLLRFGYRLPHTTFRAPFGPDGKSFVVPGAGGVRLLPLRTRSWQRDPRALLREAEQRAGRKLKGFTLRTQ